MLDEGKERWKTLHRGELVNKADIDILSRFNSEVRGIYNYYRLANNVSILNSFAFIMGGSMYKTFACKYNTTASDIRKRYTRDGVFGVEYTTKDGPKRAELYHDGFKRQNSCLKTEDNIDILPNYRKYMGTNSLAMRLLAGACELCGKKDVEIHMHYVRALKDLTGSSECERIMMSKRRKSIALYAECYENR